MAGHKHGFKFASVKGSADKIIPYLSNQIANSCKCSLKVVFLGETHDDQIDMAVTKYILRHPPVIDPLNSRIIWEHGLPGRYAPWPFPGDISNDFNVPGLVGVFAHPDQDEDPFHGPFKQRSKSLADRIYSAFVNDGKRVVYMPCGSNHTADVFDYLNRHEDIEFDFAWKPAASEMG